MNILFVATECTPFIKTGGLADVVGSLPQALSKEEDVDVRVVLPRYGQIPDFYKNEMELKEYFNVPVGWRKQYCGVEKLEYEGITYYFIDNKYYFERDQIYGAYDEAERFSFFDRAVLEMLAFIEFTPDILHCHDWHTGMISVFLQAHYKYYPQLSTVFTIHNLQYQGVFPAEIMEDILALGPEYFTIDGLEYYDNVNFMKGGLNYSDVITTVSETYSNEIQISAYSEGLDGVLRQRSEDLYGIVNGLNYDQYDPETDKHLFMNYKNSFTEKRKNKLRLQEMLGLPRSENTPMLILISRLVEQKGIDLIIHVLDQILELDLQLVILGTGESEYEHVFREVAREQPEKISVNITFNEDLARKMYAAGDLFLMPSRFEPCGIGQLISLRYLTIPVVRETGGLVDTVTSYNPESGKGNGFSFKNYNAHDMLHTIKRALKYYQEEDIRENILNCDYSWQKSANKYIKLYQSLL